MKHMDTIDDCEVVLNPDSMKRYHKGSKLSTTVVDDLPTLAESSGGYYTERRDIMGLTKGKNKVLPQIKKGLVLGYNMPSVISFDSKKGMNVVTRAPTEETSGSTIEKTKSEVSSEETLESTIQPTLEPASTIEDDYRPSRFEELHRLGTQALLMKRTLNYIKVIHESKRSINFDISLNKKREKQRRQYSRSSKECHARLFALSEAKQLEGKMRREETARFLEERSQSESRFHYIVGFDAQRLAKESRSVGGSMSPYSVNTAATGDVSTFSKKHSKRSARSVQSTKSHRRKTRRHRLNSGGSTGARSQISNITAFTTNSVHDRLYNMSRGKQEYGKSRRLAIAKSSDRSVSARSELTNITSFTTNSVHDRLYSVSRAKQEYGKSRRLAIAKKRRLKALRM